MFSRLIFSSIRSANCSFLAQNGQTRNFRRAVLSPASTKKTTAGPEIPGVKVSITPGVNITPKRAPSAYNLFISEKSKSAKPGLKASEILKEVAPQWKNLSDQERQRYVDEAARLQKEYDDAFMRLSNAEFQRVVLDELQRLQSKRVTAFRRHQRDLKAEYEYPHGGQDFFKLAALGKDHQQEIKDVTDVPTRGRRIGQMWNDLSAEEKAAYEKREKAARDRYRKNVDAWEQKMKRKGLQNVVDMINKHPRKSISVTGGLRGRRRRSTKKVLASKVAIKKAEAAEKKPVTPRKRASKKAEGKEKGKGKKAATKKDEWDEE